jgi:hypothetical protein
MVISQCSIKRFRKFEVAARVADEHVVLRPWRGQGERRASVGRRSL